jgi:RNA polymerase sigma-70 factor (ECF subfamily)
MAAHLFPTSRDPLSNRETPPSEAREAEPSPGRTAEISQLFRDHNRALVLFLASRLKDIQAAREVAQEAYVRVLQLESPGAISFLRSYLFKVAANLAIDRLRSQQSHARLDPVEPFDNFLDEATPERTVIAREELELLGAVIAELPMKYQEAFYRHRINDESFEDIARRMGLKDRMVRRYVTYTLLYLRLRREGIDAREAWRQVQS